MGGTVLDSDIVTDVVIARLSFHLNATVGGGDCCAPHRESNRHDSHTVLALQELIV